jgi:hypothetical protein
VTSGALRAARDLGSLPLSTCSCDAIMAKFNKMVQRGLVEANKTHYTHITWGYRVLYIYTKRPLSCIIVNCRPAVFDVANLVR